MADALQELLDLPRDVKEEKGLLHTPSEIRGQAKLWGSTHAVVEKRLEGVRSFLGRFLEHERRTVVLTGAGTSEFVGHCIEGRLRKGLGAPVNVVSSTKIATNPEDVFIEGYHTLLVSFARSGDSPESVGAVEIADQTSGTVSHLVVTCNAEGALNRWAERRAASGEGAARSGTAAGRVFSLCLDERTDDKGLAMTASFTNMVVAGILLSHAFGFGGCGDAVRRAIEAGKNLLARAPDTLRTVCDAGFDRAVFLGDGALCGTAVESHLKLQELTAGKVMCAWDSFPGLRHGPEAVVDGRTLVVAYLSEDPYRRRYEEDLLAELREKGLGKALLVCGGWVDGRTKALADAVVDWDPEGTLKVGDDYSPPVAVITGQLLGLFKSISLGLKPDAPSEGGIIHRVVKGVKVYDPAHFRKTGKFKVIAER